MDEGRDMARIHSIVSWNAKRENDLSIPSVERLLSLGADAIFLQEVNERSLDKLYKRFGEKRVGIATEVISKRGMKLLRYHLATIIPEGSSIRLESWRRHSLESSQEVIYKMIRRDISIEYIEGRVCLEGRKFSLVNCHLQYATSPRVREKQFLEILARQEKDREVIIGGDLNTFVDLSYGFLFSPFFGLKWRDVLKKESRVFVGNRLFENPMPGVSSTVYGTGRLDHIYLPKGAEILEERMLGDRMDSDHYPVLARFRLKGGGECGQDVDAMAKSNQTADGGSDREGGRNGGPDVAPDAAPEAEGSKDV